MTVLAGYLLCNMKPSHVNKAAGITWTIKLTQGSSCWWHVITFIGSALVVCYATCMHRTLLYIYFHMCADYVIIMPKLTNFRPQSEHHINAYLVLCRVITYGGRCYNTSMHGNRYWPALCITPPYPKSIAIMLCCPIWW